MLKRRAGKARNPSELRPVEMLFLRDEELPPDHSFEDECAWWSMLGLAGGRGGPYEPRDPDGFLGPARPSVAEMWKAVGEGIVQEWAREAPGSRPSCWWEFEAPEPRRPGEAQAEYLRRHNLLLPGEADRLAAEPAQAQ